MAKPAMKLLRHFPAGFGPRTRCCKEKKGETAMFVLLRIKNRPTRHLVAWGAKENALGT